MNNHTSTNVNPACQVAAELGMRKGYEIMSINPCQPFWNGMVDITSDVSVIVTAQDEMHVRIWSLTGSIAADYPRRFTIDEIITDIESALSQEEL